MPIIRSPAQRRAAHNALLWAEVYQGLEEDPDDTEEFCADCGAELLWDGEEYLPCDNGCRQIPGARKGGENAILKSL